MIKKLILLLSLVFCQPALAKNPTVDSPNKKPWIAFDFTIAPSVAYFLYREYAYWQNYGVFMDIKGPIYGFETNLKINFNPTGLGFMVVPFDVAVYDGAKLVYTGSQGDSRKAIYGSLIVYNQHISLFWYRFLAGPSWTFLDHYRLNFLSGYGYKYTTHTGLTGYSHRINELRYVPLILQLQYRGDIITLLLHAEYDILLGGIQRTGSTYKLSSGYNYQNTGWGARVLGEFSFYGVTIAPFFNYFWVDDSDFSYTIDYTGNPWPGYLPAPEPRNITIETGVKVGYQF